MENIKKLGRSFANAFRGLAYILSKEQNFRIEIFAAFLVILAMIFLHVQRWEAVVLIFTITAVLVLEIINTMLERLINIFRPRIHPYVGMIKDIMAAGVFVASLGATIIGLIIFLPHIF